MAKDKEAEEQVVDEVKEIVDQSEETEVGTSTRGARGDGAPPLKVPSIDALLGDIYELRYQASHLSARMYLYHAKRDRFHRERDEALASSQDRGANTYTKGSSQPSVFI